MNTLASIAQAVAVYEANPNTYTRRKLATAYDSAADVIAGTYRRPDKPVISDVTPEWIARTQTQARKLK